MLDMDTIGAIEVKASGAWTDIGEVWHLSGGTWSKVWQETGTLAVSVDLAYPTGAGSSALNIVVQSAPVTLSITGGTPPYTIAWARVGTGSPAWTITAPDAATTRFSTTVGAGDTETAEFAASITDSIGGTVTSPSVYPSVTNFGGF